MPRLFVVEGPDGAGKSTLLRRLAADMFWPVLHTGGPPKTRSDLEEKFIRVEAALAAAPTKGVLVDRHPAISEPIYRRATNETCMITPALMLERLRAQKPVVVYCRLTSIADMWQSIDRAKKAHKPQEHLEQVLRSYRGIVDDYDALFDDPDHGFTLLRYNWRLQSYDSILKQVRLCVD